MTTRLGTSLGPRGPLGSFAGRLLFITPRPAGTFTAIGTRLFPRRAFGNFAGRGLFVAPSQKVSGIYTRLGPRLMPQGRLGNFLGRISVAPTVIDVPKANLTFTSLTPQNVLQDTVIDVIGIEAFFTSFDPDIVQGGVIVDVPLAHLTFTMLTPDGISQTGASDVLVDVPVAHLTFTALDPTVQYAQVIDVPAANLTFTPFPLQVDITLPGQQTLTQTDITAIWEDITISGFSPRDLLRIIAAVSAGKLNGARLNGGGQIIIRSIDGLEEVVLAQYDEAGNRVHVVIDP
jgi:hypothetical protein